MRKPATDLTGQRFERLTVLRRLPNRSNQAYWLCLCDCGNESAASGQMLRDGRHKSCGCLKRERITAQSTKHGGKRQSGATPTYTSWSNMMRRCTKPDNPRYPGWGGRGIAVCERWHDYANFLADMGERQPGMTLERVDNDGPYDPDNCVWASFAVQARNKRSTKLTPEAIFRIRDLAEAGGGVQEIAAATGIRRHTVGTVMATIAALSDSTHPQRDVSP